MLKCKYENFRFYFTTYIYTTPAGFFSWINAFGWFERWKHSLTLTCKTHQNMREKERWKMYKWAIDWELLSFPNAFRLVGTFCCNTCRLLLILKCKCVSLTLYAVHSFRSVHRQVVSMRLLLSHRYTITVIRTAITISIFLSLYLFICFSFFRYLFTTKIICMNCILFDFILF